MVSPCLAGLVQAAQKRRLLGRVPAQRLADYAQSRGILSDEALRAWLTTGDGLSPDLGKKLLALLPKPETRRFGAYNALAHLADGGMGSVWLAHREGSDDLVVVKTMKAGLAQTTDTSRGTELLRRFERETSITRQLDHPNVVRCIDGGVADANTMFMVLEYVDSGDLRDLVDAKGGLSEGLALAILYQVVDGLAEAHRLKLIHRDIKPPNIFVSSEGRAKLADFGIARSTESNRTMLTMEGAIVGSPQYMSPEQIITDPSLDIRSDIYALGCVLYFCLTAEAPYKGKLQEILHQHCTAAIPDPRQKRARLGEGVVGIITKAMAKDRGQRYQDPAEMRDAILAVMKGLGLHAGAPSEESTALRDFSGRETSGVHRDIATLTADLRRQAGLDDIATIADPSFMAGAATITVDAAARSEQATMAANLNQDLATMAADLSGGDAQATMPMNQGFCDAAAVTVGSGVQPGNASANLPTMAADLSDMATMTASLLKQEFEEPDRTEPAAKEPGTSATVHEEMGTIARILAGKEPTVALAGEPFAGDISQGLAEPWICLSPTTPGPDQVAVVLFAKTSVLLGKLKEAPVDICLRNYPVAIHKESCQRLSRSHLVLRYDPVQNRCQVEDQNAANGTMVDGIALGGGGQAVLAPGVDNIIDMAGVVTLWARCLPRQGSKVRAMAGVSGTPGVCGLDTDNGFDAVTLSRPENRPEMAYALVLRRLSLGGPGSDLPLAGAKTRTAVEVARFTDRWIWRTAPTPGQQPGPWQPLAEGTTMDCGGRQMVVRRGDHSVF